MQKPFWPRLNWPWSFMRCTATSVMGCDWMSVICARHDFNPLTVVVQTDALAASSLFLQHSAVVDWQQLLGAEFLVAETCSFWSRIEASSTFKASSSSCRSSSSRESAFLVAVDESASCCLSKASCDFRRSSLCWSFSKRSEDSAIDPVAAAVLLL